MDTMLNFRKQTSQYAKPWQDAGLSFLLIEDDERRANLKKSKAQEIQKEVFKPKLDAKSSAKVLDSSPRSSEEAKEKATEKVITPLNADVLKDYAWPALWVDLWAKAVKHQAPKIAWTYTGLHDDIMATESKNEERQEVVRVLVNGLKQANGTHVFIPYDSANAEGRALFFEDKSFYWSAISRLKVQHLFVFGSKARDELHLPQRGMGVVQFHGFRVYILPEINGLIGNMANVRALLEFLKSQLSSVKI